MTNEFIYYLNGSGQDLSAYGHRALENHFTQSLRYPNINSLNLLTMPIRFKDTMKGQPGVIGGGIKKHYATPVKNGELTLAGMTKAVEKICTASGADIRAVTYAMVDVAIDSLANGTIVRLGDLGSLRITLSAEGQATAEDVTASTIKSVGVIFTPGTRIKEILATAKFEKV